MTLDDLPNSPVTKVCLICHRRFASKKRGKAGEAQIYCSRACWNNRERKTVVKKCLQCGVEFTFPSTGKRKNDKRKFCGNSCAAKWRMAQPERIELAKEYLPRAWAASQAAHRGKLNPAASDRMKTNNPNQSPEWKKKMSAIMSGRTFLARGGNGALTRQQQAISKALGFPMEYAIPTAPVKDQFKTLPTCYKVDVADPSRMLAIEIDGSTHKTKKWQFLDKRKTAVLNALGWTVLRFWNERVDTDLEGVVREIQGFAPPE